MRTIIFLLLAAFAGTSAQAAASSDENAVSVVVDVRDLQLTDEAGVRRLNRRVAQAAMAVCGPSPTRGVRDQAHFGRCRVAALSDAQRRVEMAVAAARRENTRLAAAK